MKRPWWKSGLIYSLRVLTLTLSISRAIFFVPIFPLPTLDPLTVLGLGPSIEIDQGDFTGCGLYGIYDRT